MHTAFHYGYINGEYVCMYQIRRYKQHTVATHKPSTQIRKSFIPYYSLLCVIDMDMAYYTYAVYTFILV